MNLRFGSVCSGIEAASVAWHPLGWEAAWLCEIEPFPCAVLAHHYPSVPNYGDMMALPERIRSGEVEAPSLFCGGTPCQAFSVAGNRRSLDDARGNLSLTFCEIADAIDYARTARGGEPAIIFWENVPGVLNTKDNAFGCFLAGLAGEDVALEPPGGKWTDAGFVSGPARNVAWRALDAQYFGLAQRRKRVFVVASAREGFDPAAVLFEFDGMQRHTPPSREARQGITADAETGVITGGGIPEIAGTIMARDFKGVNTFDMEEGKYAVSVGGNIAHTLRGEGFDASEDGTGRGQPIVAIEAPPHAFKIRGGCEGGGKGYLGMDEQVFTITTGHDQQVAVPVAAFKGGQGSAAGSLGYQIELSPTLNAADSGSNRTPVLLQQYAVRRLTPVECERLQGFPDGYTNIPWRNKPEAPDGPRYKALGNSWAVPVVRWIGRRIASAIQPTVESSTL